jgi:hypothetical protein
LRTALQFNHKKETQLKLFSKLFAVVTLFIASAFAQGTYSAPRFSATFNGSVEVSTRQNQTNTALGYASAAPTANGVAVEFVEVRSIDHDIDVSTVSSDFYRTNHGDQELVEDTRVRSNGTYQGHPYSYGFYNTTINGVQYVQSIRFIIVDSRTAIFISLTEPRADAGLASSNAVITGWESFEDSLNIR